MRSRSNVGVGVLAGIFGGLLFGAMIAIMNVPSPAVMEEEISMMRVVAMVVGSTNIWMGLFFHMFTSGVIGAIFGALFYDRVVNYRIGAFYGIVYAFAWWVVGWLTILPIMIGLPAFAPLTMGPGMLQMAGGSLLGHLVYGLVLGGTFVRMYQPSIEHIDKKEQKHAA